MEIRAVLFDLGGVVVSLDWLDVAEVWGSRLGLQRQAFLDQLFGGSDDRVLIGKMEPEDWWRDVVCPRLGVDEAWLERFLSELDEREQIDPRMAEFVTSLRPRYRTAFVSNAWSDGRARLESRFGIAGMVDDLVLSAEVGTAKPGERIYRLACERLGVEPDEAVFVDDSPANVEGARAVGMRAVLHVDRDATIREVRALLG